VLSKKAIANVSESLRVRTEEILNDVSFGLEIMSVDVGMIMQPTPGGVRPVWLVTYQAKGALIGTKYYNIQGTIVEDPFIVDEALRAGLTTGCDMLRAERAKQSNGEGLTK
jgi:hypothetical protein